MGFGFSFALIFIMLPLTVVLLLIWLLTRKRAVGRVLGGMWLVIFVGILLVATLGFLTNPKVLTPKDYYGQYVIDRQFFSGKQADWQYEHYRIEITKEDTIHFYVIENGKILNTYTGTVSTRLVAGSARLVINMDMPTHHIMAENPTTYRSVWSFYLVFHSAKFNNLYFTKGDWQPLP